jgi:hypothetical protein
LQLADDIASNTSAISTKLMPDSMYRGPDSAEGTHLLDSRLIYSLFGSKDNEEGVKSFFEKKSPHFGGTVPADAPEVYLWWNPTDVGSKPQVSSPGGKAKLYAARMKTSERVVVLVPKPRLESRIEGFAEVGCRG